MSLLIQAAALVVLLAAIAVRLRAQAAKKGERS